MRTVQSMSLIDLMGIEKHRPEGHCDIRDAHNLLEKEYDLSHKTEKRLSKRYPKIACFRTNLNACLKICNRICDSLGTRKIKSVCLENTAPASAYYDHGKICVSYSTVGMRTLFHELAHHVTSKERIHGTCHGKEFCNIMELIWEAANEIYRFPS